MALPREGSTWRRAMRGVAGSVGPRRWRVAARAVAQVDAAVGEERVRQAALAALLRLTGDEAAARAALDDPPRPEVPDPVALVAGHAAAALARLRAGAVARREAAILEAVFDSLQEGIIVRDAEGRLVRQNRPGAALVPEPPLRLTPADVQDPRFFRPDGHPVDVADLPVAKVLATGQPATGELLTGEGRLLSVSAAPMPDGGVVVTYRDVSDLAVLLREREALLGALISAQEDERRRIAGELHDDTVQVLVASLLRLDILQHHLDKGDPEAATGALEMLRTTLQRTLSSTRQLLFDLRPPLLDEHGLVAAIRSQLERLSAGGVAVEINDRTGRRLGSPIETVAYRILQEAAANITRHARATRVVVDLAHDDGTLTMTISDDGVGFEPTEMGFQPGHLGLRSMRERAELAGGAFTLESAPGAGTVVRVRLPLAQPAARRDVRARGAAGAGRLTPAEPAPPAGGTDQG